MSEQKQRPNNAKGLGLVCPSSLPHQEHTPGSPSLTASWKSHFLLMPFRDAFLCSFLIPSVLKLCLPSFSLPSHKKPGSGEPCSSDIPPQN